MKGAERLETRLGFRIPSNLHDQVLKVCKDRNISKSEFILESITSNLSAEVEQ